MSLDPQTVPFLRSCERCRQKKRKCTGEKPSCSWCSKHSVPCRYRRSLRFKKQLKDCSPSSLDVLKTPVVIVEGTKEQVRASSLAEPELKPTPKPKAKAKAKAAPAATAGAAEIQNKIPAQVTSPSLSLQLPNETNGSSSMNLTISPTIQQQQQQQHLQQPPPQINGSASIHSSQDGMFSADAITRLLSVDMVPQSNPPANLVQAANSFMTPFAANTPFSRPEWTTATNTEANMLANLGDWATSWDLNSQHEWMPVVLDDLNIGYGGANNISQSFLNGEFMFGLDSGVNQQELQDILMPLSGAANAGQYSNPVGLQRNGVPSASSVPTLPTAVAVTAAQIPKPLAKSHTTSSQHSPLSTESFNAKNPFNGQRRVSIHGFSAGNDSRRNESIPKDHFHTNFGPPLPMSPIYGMYDARPHLPDGQARSSANNSFAASDSLSPLVSNHGSAEARNAHGSIRQPVANTSSRPPTASPKGSHSPSPAIAPRKSVFEVDEIPPMLRQYVAEIPGNPSPEVVYKIMRESFRAPRMGMVSLNFEILWYMLHKGVLPRIAFYGDISSTVRCSVANVDIKSMVPPDIDESCYQLALKEVPLVKDCSEIWGAIGLCMLARYEFQSLRYKEMDEHAAMAIDVLRRIKYMGHSYPWHNVRDKDKESFEFQYLLAIFWKSFLWKLVSFMLIENGSKFDYSLDRLPVYSSKTFDLYTTSQPYDVDLMAMIPKNSWLGANSGPPPKLRFRGPSDKEFMRMRPENSPCFNRLAASAGYVQQLIVIFAGFNMLISKAKRNEVGLEQVLKGLWIFKERMRVWRYSLPSALVLDNGLVAEYIEAISPSSTASRRDIDIKASQLKDIIMMLMMYHTFLVRANRYVMKMMAGEPIDLPPPDVSTSAFGIRDLYDCTSLPQIVSEGLGYMNMYFHGCRIQAITSANALCSLVQAAYACKFNFYTLGSPIIFTMYEVLVTYVSFLRNCDENITWRAKSRLSNVFNILRMLRHWAPALNLFVAGIKALSDPKLCLDEPRNFQAFKRDVMDPAMMDMAESPVDSLGVSEDEDRAASMFPPKRRRVVRLPRALESANDARTNILTSSAPLGAHAFSDVKRDETLSYRAADPVPEFPNPFPRKHVITLIIKDLGLSLAAFLAPAYPILLLKLMPTDSIFRPKASTSSLSPSAGHGNAAPGKL